MLATCWCAVKTCARAVLRLEDIVRNTGVLTADCRTHSSKNRNAAEDLHLHPWYIRVLIYWY